MARDTIKKCIPATLTSPPTKMLQIINYLNVKTPNEKFSVDIKMLTPKLYHLNHFKAS